MTPRWFFDSISSWERQDETPYLINVHPDDRIPSSPMMAPSSMGFEDLEDQMMLSSDGEGERNLEEMRDADDIMPSNNSPPPNLQEIDWGDVDDELLEFMGSDAEDLDGETDTGGQSDNESVSSDTEKRGRRTSIIGKRDRSTTPPPDEDEAAAAAAVAEKDRPKPQVKKADKLKVPSSRLAKRQKLARNRTTSLRNVMSSQEDLSGEAGMLSPASSQVDHDSDGENDADGDGEDEADAEADGNKDKSADGDNNDDDDDNDFDFEAEMAKEFE